MLALTPALGSCPRPVELPDADLPDASLDTLILDVWGEPSDAYAPPDSPDVDARPSVDDPGWSHVGALPDECEIDVAAHPDRVLSPWVWETDCGAGCVRWGNTANLLDVFESDGVPVAVLIGETPRGATDPWRYTVFAELDSGRALFALRDRGNVSEPHDTPSCEIDTGGAGAGSFAVAVSFADYDVTGDVLDRSWMILLRAEAPGAHSSVRGLYLREDWGSRFVRRVVVSPTHVGAIFGSRVPVLVGNDGSYVVPGSGTDDGASSIESLTFLGSSDLLWESRRDPDVLVRSRGGTAPAVLRAVDGGDVRGFATDGRDLAWLEGLDVDPITREYANVSLWTAGYDATGLVSPRRVADVRGATGGALGGGYYAHAEVDVTDPTHAIFAFYRLSDGARATFDPGDLPAARVFWLSATDSVVEALGQRYRIDPRALSFVVP